MNIYQYLQEVDDKLFQWGTHDCCLLASNWLEHSKGFNPMGQALPYNSPSSALISIMDLYGVDSIYAALEIIASENNGHKIPLEQALNGDIITYDFNSHIRMELGSIDYRIGMGICYNNKGYLCQLPKGLFSVPLNQCHSAWRF